MAAMAAEVAVLVVLVDVAHVLCQFGFVMLLSLFLDKGKGD